MLLLEDTESPETGALLNWCPLLKHISANECNASMSWLWDHTQYLKICELET